MRGKIAEQSLELAVVSDHRATVQAALERCGEQKVRVEVGEHLVDRLLREGAADAGGLDLALDAEASTSPDPRLGSRNRRGNPAIVERAFLAQPRHCRIDIFGLMAAPGEALADLGL